MSKQLGFKIKTARRKLNISQGDLSKKLEISPSYLNLIESGKRKVSADLLIKASEVVEEMRKIHEEAGPEGEESLEAIRELESENGFEHLINLILLDVQKGGLDGVRKWLSTVGGLRETVSANSVAILAGESRAVSTWHYSMSDSVLNTLMYLCFLNENGSIIQYFGQVRGNGKIY